MSYTFHTALPFSNRFRPALYKFVQDINSENLTMTAHASQNEEALYGLGSYLNRLVFNVAEVFEFTVDEQGRPIKGGVRVPFNERGDICLIISVEGRIITFWFNQHNDAHTTLNKEKYDNFKIK